MTTQSSFPMNDLVLRLAGGQRDGELIPVSTPKCFLGMDENGAGQNEPQCAIFRGPNGAAVRSYGNDVLVNGIPATVHWLQEGDRIEFPNSMTVEVAQLGWVEQANDNFEGDPSSNCLVDEPRIKESEPNEIQGVEMSMGTNSTEEPATELRLNLIESQIRELQSQKAETQSHLDQLETQLTSLTDQLSQLVAPSASETDTSSAESNDSQDSEESFVTLGSDGHAEPTVPEEPSPASVNNGFVLAGDDYTHHDEDDEKIMTFDSTAPEPELDLATNVEVTDAPGMLSGVSQEEINTRQSELARVFSGTLFGADSANPSETNHTTADEQQAESLDTPTHGLDEDAVSSADYLLESGQADPNVSDDTGANPASPELEPGSLASQLLMDVTVESEEVSTAEADQEEPVQSSPQPQSSVADLLARMKAEGQWGGIPDDDAAGEPIESVPVPVFEAPENTSESESEEGADVQDYMSELLNRMRGDVPAKKAAPKPVEQKVQAEVKTEHEPDVTPEFVPPVNPLKADEFKPMRKAPKIASLNAMRELANSTTRSNVHLSEQRNRKELGYLQLGIASASFFMAVYYFLVESVTFMDTGFIVGTICVGISGYLCYRYYSSIKLNEMLADLTVSAQKKSAPIDAAAAEPTIEAEQNGQVAQMTHDGV